MSFVALQPFAWSILASVHTSPRRWPGVVASRRPLVQTGSRARITWQSMLPLLLILVEASRRKVWLEIGRKALWRRAKWHAVWHVWRTGIRAEWRKWHTPAARQHHTTLAGRSAEGWRRHSYVCQYSPAMSQEAGYLESPWEGNLDQRQAAEAWDLAGLRQHMNS